jgi:large conductance mechanosensitive channel
MWKEFKEFAMKGNMVDLAVGVIIGTAFNKVVTSIVNDVVMPPIGLMIGRVNFSSLFISLNGVHYDSVDQAKAAGAPTLNYGIFINNMLDFLIVAIVIFIVVKQMNRLRSRSQQPKAPDKKEPVKICSACKSEIHAEATRCKFCTSEVGTNTQAS